MTPELYQQILAHGAAVNLSAHAKFRLTGADRTRYLNGQVTNDVRRAKTDAALYACVTDAKGRIAADIHIHAHDDTLLLDAEPDLREPLGMRLERYIVADDVELTDVTDDWQLWHVWSDASTPARNEGLLSQEAAHTHALHTNRYGAPGLDLWLPASAAAPTFDALPVLSAHDLEAWRILQHIPRWPHELNAETFPPEAGLESTAMDFAKGCYIGQEVLSRIKTTGKMPRELISFESAAAVQAGDELWLEKAVGTVTSVTQHPVTGRSIGLAMIRQGTAKESLRVGSSNGALLMRS
ncbi:CAF17-like 4Fe-4S cluster assembly/insertion protein YgfZ [Prosthecobacter vanneervenii]|uniref:Folate-binding protein YgfZ n=1 Tax=Prosthecobacter vanneervenii TaxID=48466 RepID=A0A7W7YBH6_9BACT|nr:glycine cleavage T C-terminal barrel domain-containing protein [Prosthecobacter vanneervenii]MBB5033118.1 folate-binding protein YgfZ [Prosthecobacter vanneervenii]